MKALELILKFIEKHAPWFLMGYWAGSRKADKLKVENTKLKLELDVKNESEKIAKHNASLSDADLKSEILGN